MPSPDRPRRARSGGGLRRSCRRFDRRLRRCGLWRFVCLRSGRSGLRRFGGRRVGFGGAAETSSPSPARIAITVPTFTPSVPSATRILAIVPSSTASNSIVALSVSISARMSPDFTLSPSLTSHLASVPSSIVGDRAGILSSIGMSVFPLRQARGHKANAAVRVKARRSANDAACAEAPRLTQHLR